MSAPESALVVLVPEAEAVVKPFRDVYDPSAIAGVPAHITILYPFRRPDTIDDAVMGALRFCIAAHSAFDMELTAIRRFPGVLYLAPTDPEPFRALTRAVWQRYPETPPYGGKHPAITPHLTVARVQDAARLEQISQEFESAAGKTLPIRARATTVSLLENRTGRWQQRAALPLRV